MRPPRDPMSVQSVEDAMAWLFRHTRPEEYIYSSEADLPAVVIFACDMFWVRPADFIRRMRRMWEFTTCHDDGRSYRSRRRRIGGR